MGSDRPRTRVGHVYRIKRRIGHIYPRGWVPPVAVRVKLRVRSLRSGREVVT